MSFEEPTQRLTVRPRDIAAQTAAQTTAAQTTAALPRPLDLAGATPPSSPDPADKTEELSLDEIFSAPPAAPPAPPAVPSTPAQPAHAEEAPTWTAMPVIPVRSEPVSAATASVSAPAPEPKTAQTKTERTGPSTGQRMLSDASAALDGAIRRGQAWLSHGDNGLMLMTAIVAIILILVVGIVRS